MNASLRVRLLLSAAVLVGLALALIWATLSSLFSGFIAREYERQLVAVIDTLAANMEKDAQGWRLTTLPSDPRYSIPASGLYWQVMHQGRDFDHSRSLWDGDLVPGETALAGTQLFQMTGPDEETLLGVSQPIILGEGGGEFAVEMRAAINRSEYDAARDDFSSRLALMLAIAGAVLIAASALQVYVGLLPLNALRDGVSRIRAGAIARMPLEGPSETMPLVGELNELLEARESDVEKARQRAADLAHGLKTPLTVLAQIADRLRQKRAGAAMAQEMHEQIDTIRQRVDRQLALARMSGLHAASTEAGGALARLVEVMRRISAAQKLQWRLEAGEGLTLAADPADFSEAVGNVLDNARKWARTTVLVTAQRRGRLVAVGIEDDGEGVPDAEISRVLERGGRLDTAASETGLGLAISREIVEAHGGAIALARSPLGGLKVELSWPARG
jgi:signal transduction histidine kinase